MTDATAKVHLIVAHAIPGFTALHTPTVCLLSEANAKVWLTVDPDELFIHVDRKNALANLLFTGGLGESFQERFNSAIATVSADRKQQARSHAWLVTDAFLSAHLGPGTSRE